MVALSMEFSRVSLESKMSNQVADFFISLLIETWEKWARYSVDVKWFIFIDFNGIY